MTQWIGYAVLGIGVLCLVAWLVGKIAAMWPGSVPSGVADVAGKIGDYADQTAGVTAYLTLKALAAKRGDEAMRTALGPVWVAIDAWDEEAKT